MGYLRVFLWRIYLVVCSLLLLSYRGTPLNNPLIEIHANSLMFALVFWPHVATFWIFWLHECLYWRLKFHSKLLFWYQSRQIFEVRVIEQRHHEFQLASSPVLTTILFQWPVACAWLFEIFSKQICNVEALCSNLSFYKKHLTLTQPLFLRDTDVFRSGTIFYRHYKGLHQIRKDLVLYALTICWPPINMHYGIWNRL